MSDLHLEADELAGPSSYKKLPAIHTEIKYSYFTSSMSMYGLAPSGNISSATRLPFMSKLSSYKLATIIRHFFIYISRNNNNRSRDQNLLMLINK